MLKGKWALVTGATNGIGKAIALKFGENGAQVVVVGTNKERAEKVVDQLHAMGASHSFYTLCDVSNYDDVQQAMIEILKQTETMDIVVNNAGICRDALLMRMESKQWDEVIDVNLKSVFNVCKALCRQMMRQRSGKIINISSVVGLTGNAGQVNYSASKAGIIGLTKSLAKELAGRGICANCIAPGFIETQMTTHLPDKIKETLLHSILMRRMGQPEEIANVALFLASTMADYMTGQTLSVDGGMV